VAYAQVFDDGMMKPVGQGWSQIGQNTTGVYCFRLSTGSQDFGRKWPMATGWIRQPEVPVQPVSISVEYIFDQSTTDCGSLTYGYKVRVLNPAGVPVDAPFQLTVFELPTL
jgi:hypothetical protein